ncbi:MAG TPA: NAD(P)-dependent oxidoreductase [Beijerinckiaceae bacterium]|jgi:nucleoside-diphosphate-sugar epimerase
MGETVLVAGAAGFVGSAVTRACLQHGLRVIAVDNFLHGVPENLSGLPLRVHKFDLSDFSGLAELITSAQIDYIVNAAGDTFVPAAYDYPGRFVSNNIVVTLNLLQAARIGTVRRMLQLSTTEIYGITDGSALNENSPIAPVNTYAVTKLAADQLCFTYSDEHGVPVTVLRLFNTYGPGATHPYVIPEIISQLSRGDTVRLGNLDAARDFTYVTDTAAAVHSLLAADMPRKGVFNVGSGQVTSVRELVEHTAAAMGVASPRLVSDAARLRRMDISVFRCDSSRLRAATGWQPRVSIEEGLKRTIDSYRRRGNVWPWELSLADAASQVDVTSCSPLPARDRERRYRKTDELASQG